MHPTIKQIFQHFSNWQLLNPDLPNFHAPCNQANISTFQQLTVAQSQFAQFSCTLQSSTLPPYLTQKPVTKRDTAHPIKKRFFLICVVSQFL